MTSRERRYRSLHEEGHQSFKMLNTTVSYLPSMRKPLLPAVQKNKDHLSNYNNTIRLLEKRTIEQISQKLFKVQARPNIRQRMLVSKQTLQQKIQDAVAQEFVTQILKNPTKPIVKGTVQLPLQNEYAYSMPESRQGCRVVKLHSMGVLLGGYSHKEHIDINVISLSNGQWKRKQDFYPAACEKLRQRLKHNVTLPLGCDFSACEDDKVIYTFGGQRNVGSRRTSNVLTRIQFSQDFVEWTQHTMNLPPRRNHIGGLVEKNLLIIGGLDDADQRTIYYSDFNSINLQTLETRQFWPRCFNTAGKQVDPFFKSGIAYHSAIVVGNPHFLIKADYTQMIKQDDITVDPDFKSGLYIFGGKNADDRLYDQLYLLQTDYQVGKLLEIETFGCKPSMRRSCSLNYEEQICALIVFGGTDDRVCFGDLFLLFIRNYTWASVKLSGYLHFEPRFDHCAVYHEDKLLIFGGLCENGYLLFNPLQISIRFKKKFDLH